MPAAKPYLDQHLQIAATAGFESDLLEDFGQSWADQHGAKVSSTFSPILEFRGDIAIVNAAELPAMAESGQFLPVPSSFLNREHALQWDGFLPDVSGLLASWQGATYGIPLRGEGRVMVYRKDLFEAAKLAPPRTWEDFVAAARLLAKPGQPSLPVLPSITDAREAVFQGGANLRRFGARSFGMHTSLETEFLLIAACYDRPAVNQGEVGSRIPDEQMTDRLYSFLYRLKTAEPRINAPAFRHAFELMREMQPFRGGNFGTGHAALAIVSLRELARYQAIGSPVCGKIGVAPLPGATFTYDFDTGERVPTRSNEVNRLPYLGSDIWYGIVGRNCANPDMAFAFLADFANPEKYGAEMITAAIWGAGPTRSLHTEDRVRGLWFGYNLTPRETESLVNALKSNLATSVVNRRYCLRLPNQEAHSQAFDRIVRPALKAEKADAVKTLGEVNDAWTALWKDIPDAQRKRWVEGGHGLGSRTRP
ncbi:MAG: extracellular solute-binding protein [Planctomycetes bacterium]|nr:extracellular solute-binding protein [Planctomycetota bacterium]